MADIPQVHPPWGALPAEQYLIISHPDPCAATTSSACFSPWRPTPPQWDGVRHGVRRSTATPREAALTSTPTRVPTPHEIATILQPWRPLSVRRMAAHILTRSDDTYADNFWIRTDYAIEKDPAWENLLDEKPDNDLFYVFSAGEPKQEEYLSEPRIAHYKRVIGRALSASEQERVDREKEELRERAREEIAENGFPPILSPEDKPDLDAYEAVKTLQMGNITSSVVLVDSEALNTGKVLLLALDSKGMVVRWMRLEPYDIEILVSHESESRLENSGYFEEVEGGSGVGPRYNPDGGEFAGDLYGL
ncbi:hypothetical protein B0H66DRAFT_614562 [Apodospora peruviana]|uniref:Uncharacterized protein n=1 Tax=Apodospora peruviana TaxID=516989 RepID=A0AAE0LY51_9PEZI|nr:hypothetical protein B0H66DRAFT_614562 [Apodospora peruviana]